MKLTEISQYDARPGVLTEWRLDQVTIAAAAASPQDRRPPSYIQDAHVRTAATLRQIGVEAPTWLATAFDFHGPLDVRAMKATLLQWITRHETLRSGLRLEGQELNRFTLSPEAVSLEPVVVDAFTSGAAMVRYLEDRFDAAADPLTWPPYLFATVEHENAFTIYLAFDHSNVDGYSIAQIAHEVHELYDAALADRPAELPEAGSYVDFSQLEHDAAADLDARGCARRLRRRGRDAGARPNRPPRGEGAARGTRGALRRGDGMLRATRRHDLRARGDAGPQACASRTGPGAGRRGRRRAGAPAHGSHDGPGRHHSGGGRHGGGGGAGAQRRPLGREGAAGGGDHDGLRRARSIEAPSARRRARPGTDDLDRALSHFQAALDIACAYDAYGRIGQLHIRLALISVSRDDREEAGAHLVAAARAWKEGGALDPTAVLIAELHGLQHSRAGRLEAPAREAVALVETAANWTGEQAGTALTPLQRELGLNEM